MLLLWSWGEEVLALCSAPHLLVVESDLHARFDRPDSFSCSHRMALRRRSGARRVAFAKNWLRLLPLASKDAGNILAEFALSEQPSLFSFLLNSLFS